MGLARLDVVRSMWISIKFTFTLDLDFLMDQPQLDDVCLSGVSYNVHQEVYVFVYITLTTLTIYVNVDQVGDDRLSAFLDSQNEFNCSINA